MPEIGLLPFPLAGRQDRGVLHQIVLERPDLLLLRENLAIPRRELAFDAGAGFRRLRSLIEDDRDVDETDLEFRGAHLKTESEHHAQETGSGRDLPGQEDWLHGQKLVPIVS